MPDSALAPHAATLRQQREFRRGSVLHGAQVPASSVDGWLIVLVVGFDTAGITDLARPFGWQAAS